jgi:hypothetical protein
MVASFDRHPWNYHTGIESGLAAISDAGTTP